MQELIERLEKATGPDRALDGDIAEYLGLGPAGYRRGKPEWQSHIWFAGAESWEAPRYTESIDAALTLVPEGKRAVIDGIRCFVVDKHDYAWPYRNGSYGHSAANSAIALCIAALKARQAMASVTATMRETT